MQMRKLMLKKLGSSYRKKLIKNLRREVMESREQLQKEKAKDRAVRIVKIVIVVELFTIVRV